MTDPEPTYTYNEWLEIVEDREEKQTREEISRKEEEERQRKAREVSLREEYLSMPPIKRIECWYTYTNMWPISESFAVLGRALSDWAKEQQNSP